MKTSEITALLDDWSQGDAQALDDLIPLVYDELHQMARRYFKNEARGHTLQPTALIHELYGRLASQRKVQWENRAHFFGFAAQTLRRVLIDHARVRDAHKRGAGVTHIPLDESVGISLPRNVDLLDLDHALSALARLDERQSRIVEMRFFAGLSLEDIAAVLEISRATVCRDWATARAWLLHRLDRG